MIPGITASGAVVSLYGPPETRGPTATSNTTTAFSGIQEVDLIVMADLVIDEVRWDLHANSGNFTLRIDGNVINSRTGVSGADVDMLSGAGPINLSRGLHTISITRTSGSNGWRFRAASSWVDGWMCIGYWKTAGTGGAGGEVPGVRLVAGPDSAYLWDIPHTTWSTSGTARAAVTWDVTFDEDVLLRGVTSANNTFNALELLIDDVVVGDITVLGFGSGGSFPGPAKGIYCDPSVALTGGVAYTFKVRRVDLGNFTLTQYRDSATGTGINSHFTQTNWVEAGAGVTPMVQFYFELA